MNVQRIIPILLIVILIIGLLPATAFADYYGDYTIPDGAGTSYTVQDGQLKLFAPAGYEGTETLTTIKGRFGFDDAAITWTVKNGIGTLYFSDAYILHNNVWIDGGNTLTDVIIKAKPHYGSTISYPERTVDGVPDDAALRVTKANLIIEGSETDIGSFDVRNFQFSDGSAPPYTQVGQVEKCADHIYGIVVEDGNFILRNAESDVSAGGAGENVIDAICLYVTNGNILVDVNSNLHVGGGVHDNHKTMDVAANKPAYNIYTNKSFIIDGTFISDGFGDGNSIKSQPMIKASYIRFGYGYSSMYQRKEDKRPIFSVEPDYVNKDYEYNDGIDRNGDTFIEYTYTGMVPSESNFFKYMDRPIATTTTAVTVPPTELRFTDVPATAWYYQDVQAAVKIELFNGKSTTAFAPNDNMTVAEAVKLAASMNQLHNEGKVTLANGSDKWYSTYVQYALDKGIISSDLSSRANEPISRAEYISIFYRALPESEYATKNEIADNAVPDVKAADKYANEIYAFYRAGILTGDSTGAFNSMSNIKRCEVAAILVRMMDENARKDVQF